MSHLKRIWNSDAALPPATDATTIAHGCNSESRVSHSAGVRLINRKLFETTQLGTDTFAALQSRLPKRNTCNVSDCVNAAIKVSPIRRASQCTHTLASIWLNNSFEILKIRSKCHAEPNRANISIRMRLGQEITIK